MVNRVVYAFLAGHENLAKECIPKVPCVFSTLDGIRGLDAVWSTVKGNVGVELFETSDIEGR